MRKGCLPLRGGLFYRRSAANQISGWWRVGVIDLLNRIRGQIVPRVQYRILSGESGTQRRITLLPDRPDSIDLRMMHPEDRICRRPHYVVHRSADPTMNLVVWTIFEFTGEVEVILSFKDRIDFRLRRQIWVVNARITGHNDWHAI